LVAVFVIVIFAVFFALTYVAWRRYLWAAEKMPRVDTCPYSLTDFFGDRPFANVPHQKGIKWLTEVFSRSAEKFPHLTALQIPHTGESLTFAELDARAENVAAAVSSFLTGPDQVVAVAMSQDNWQIVACHLGILNHPHAQRLTAGGRSHTRARQVLRPADARCHDIAGKNASKRTAVLAG
jgi:non-ribosomal peptide synthetase component F